MTEIRFSRYQDLRQLSNGNYFGLASLKNNSIYLFLDVLGLCWCMGFSIVAVSGDYSLVVVLGFSSQWLLLLWELWLLDTRAQA